MTGNPALAKFIAMPPPMVPAPMTATDLMARIGVLEGTSGTLAAARVAKKTCRNAFDSVLFTQFHECGPLQLHPLVEGLQHRRLHRIDAFAGSGIILGERGDGAAREIEESLGVGEFRRHVACFLQRQLVLDDALGEGDRRRHRTSASTTESNNFVFANSRAATGVPLTIMFKARSAPTRRGNRCVPPGARQNPELHFGQAELRLAADATR